MAAMRQVVLRSRPAGNPHPSDFAIEEAPIPQPGPGQLLLKTLFLSLDPYMRLGLDEQPFGGANGVSIGAPMIGSTVSEVLESNSSAFAVGDLVEARTQWREFAAVNDTQPGIRKIRRDFAPLSAALGVLGMPGQTAYAGIVTIGRVKAGETVVISAAAGAVGCIAGQIAKILGARVVGIAGGPEKCRAVVALGFDACVDYKAPDFAGQLQADVPGGVDVYFENVGGAVTRAVLPLTNYGARIPMCGFISMYGIGDTGPGPDQLPWLMRLIMLKGLEIRGFVGAVVGGAKAIEALETWLAAGRVQLRETVYDGLEAAPSAFSKMFESNNNIGKIIVRVAR